MNPFIETSLRNFVSNRDIFGESSIYMDFASKEKQHCLNSGVLSGSIVYRTQKNEEKVSVPLVLKQMPSAHDYGDYILVQYFNEIFYYTRALPFLQQSGELEKMLPKFYDSCIHSNPHTTEIILIFEDLKAQGFCNQKRFSFLDLVHLTMMVRELGRFHSYSFLAKSKYPQQFSALGNWFKYAEAELIRKEPNYFRFFAQIGLERLRQDSRYSGHIAKIEKVLDNADAFVLQVNTVLPEEPMAVLCHGDYVGGNVMFRYENGQPEEMKMIDMATCRIASPVMDLSLVLYLNTDQQTRSQHWNHLINSYYEGLCQEFGGFHVPSKESILKEFPRKALYGYLIASHFLPTLMGMDCGNATSYFFDYVPKEYDGLSIFKIPEDVAKDCINIWCNEERAEVLADILRDMVDRHFI